MVEQRMSDWDSFLEGLARDMWILSGAEDMADVAVIRNKLKDKLLQLLEAGQAMRDEAPSILGKPWDAAKEAALKEGK